jgi:hypothetical protein
MGVRALANPIIEAMLPGVNLHKVALRETCARARSSDVSKIGDARFAASWARVERMRRSAVCVDGGAAG